MESFRLPDDFMLGSATSATQIEGGDKNNSWFKWCIQGNIKDNTSSLRAADHWNRYREDIDLMKKMNQKIYRMSLEWSRIEPQKGSFDIGVIKHYRHELKLLIQNGIQPLVTLHHFSNPIWFADKGGFENVACIDDFERYTRFVVSNIGDLVSEYITINEPNVYVTNGYYYGNWPPGVKNIRIGFKVFKNLVLSHITAYKAIYDIRNDKGFEGKTMVGAAHHIRVFDPYTKNVFDCLASKLMAYLFQGAVIRAMSIGVMIAPIGFGVSIHKGCYYDFIGVNYYTRSAIHFKGFKDDVMPNTARNDLDWEIYPNGISRLCRKYYRKYKVPIWITENGTCDKGDNFRIKYIYDHLLEISKLCAEGIPVKRYYHWSLLDNFEWLDGESAPFGLVAVNFETQKRTIKKSGAFYGELCKHNGVTDEMIKIFRLK